jgi:hypothetical protein
VLILSSQEIEGRIAGYSADAEIGCDIRIQSNTA